jgi:hypothetical protein
VSEPQQHIDALLEERRVFEPAPEFIARAVVSDPAIHERASGTPGPSGSRPNGSTGRSGGTR